MDMYVTTVDEYLATIPKWQQIKIQQFRDLVHQADPNITETIKWGTPVFMLGKQMLFATAGFKEHVKYNFIYNGALLDDSDNLFNNGKESKKSRSIDLKENETIDTKSLATLIAESLVRV